MKITLDIDEGLAADVLLREGKPIDLKDGHHLKVDMAGQVVINITAVSKPMHAGGKSGASGSLSFA